MVPIAGKPILGHILDAYRSANVRDLVVVRGFAKEAVDLPGATYVDNDAFATTGEVASLATREGVARRRACLVSYGDVLFKRYVLDELLDAEGDFVIAVDSLPAQSGDAKPRRADWASAREPHSRKTLLGNVTLKDMTSATRRRRASPASGRASSRSSAAGAQGRRARCSARCRRPSSRKL